MSFFSQQCNFDPVWLIYTKTTYIMQLHNAPVFYIISERNNKIVNYLFFFLLTKQFWSSATFRKIRRIDSKCITFAKF